MTRLNLVATLRRPRWWALLGVLGMTLPLQAGAEYYSYETENGSLSYTDNPEQIPARYRDSAQPQREQSLHDWERTTRIEPRPPRPEEHVLRNTTPKRKRLSPRTLTVQASDDVEVVLPTRSDDPVIVQKGILRSNGQGTTEYTIVRQGDKVLMKVIDPIVTWVEP